ncbi:dipeptidase [Allorhodopirellula solitaria]|uniref:Membrane dipeptidase (Peptidase family M19) n=1 Tax=Allorhodopirellula solitaria TaxID=2527987 RepID=A0A5C5WJ44_9BACT|nr:dipeptidase [Allorhodopirellula solitaria]TWT50125.1 Membrane dipeptidase (Peptidase family M19) [Allorhodopirellula solitaria]
MILRKRASLVCRLPWLVFFFGLGTVEFAIDHRAGAEDPRGKIIVSDAARRIHATAPVFDGHNDLPWALRESGGLNERTDIAKSQPGFHTDIDRLRQGGVGAQFWSVYVPVSTQRTGESLLATLQQIGLVREMIERYPDEFELALTADDIERIRGEGKIASLIGVEGGHSIENSLSVLRQLYKEGARYMTLTHSKSLGWADSCTGEVISEGLSPLGEEVVREMNRLGMLVDLSHVSPDCMRDALRVTRSPVIFSHSSARGIADHPRNVPDDVLELTAQNGGVVMINFYTFFVHPDLVPYSLERSQVRDRLNQQYPDDDERVKIELRRWDLKNRPEAACDVHDVVDHIEHVIQVAGIDHVGIGSDFDGIDALPLQLEDVSTYPVITQALLDRGYNEAAIRQVLGGNLMRVLRQAEQVAIQSQQ